MRAKNTRRAMLLSALSMLLCVSMLIGTTFAWFTDTVTSGSNIIKSGNLDVEMHWADGDKALPTEEAGWNDASQDAIFNYDLWEPGYVAARHIRISNKGTLALKYHLSIEATGEVSDLADVIDVYYADPAVQVTSREDVNTLTKLGTLSEVLKQFSTTASGTLLPEANDFVTIVLKMQESAGNEYKNKSIGSSFAVKLFATQFTHEEDSFDKYYDETAAVFTVAEANAMLAQNKDVNLVGADEPTEIIYVPANYTGTLVLNNVKVASVQESDPIATVAEEDQTPVITEHKIVILGNVEVKATQEGMSAITATKLNITGDGNLTAIAKGKAAFGIGGMNTKSIIISNVTIKEVVGGEAGKVGTDTKYYKDAPEGGAAIGSGFDGAVITLNKVNVEKAVGGSKAAAIGARYHIGVTVNISNSTINAEGGATAAAIGGSRISGEQTEQDTTINIVNSVITAKGGVYGAGIGSGYDTHCKAGQPECIINIENSDINATGGKYAAGVGTGYHHAALKGEIKNSTVTAVSGEKFYKDTYTTAMDVGFGVVDPTREGKDCDSKLICNGVEITLVIPKKTVTVTTADELIKELAKVTESMEIDATGVTVEPTGSMDTTVKIPAGVTIKGAKFESNSQCYLVTTGSGDPVVFEDCDFDGPGFGMFVIAGNDENGANMVFEDCTFAGQVAPNFVNNPAGESTFINCTFTVGSDNIGLVNCMGGTHTFNNCTFDYTGGATFGSNQFVKWNAVNSYSERYSTAVILNGCTYINCGTQRYGSNSTLTKK